jgi:hypothetical protein
VTWKSIIGSTAFSDEARRNDNYTKGTLYADEEGVHFTTKKRETVHIWENILGMQTEVSRGYLVVVVVEQPLNETIYHCESFDEKIMPTLEKINQNDLLTKSLQKQKSDVGFNAHVLDGSGWSPAIGSSVVIKVLENEFSFSGVGEEVKIPFSKLSSVSVEGFTQTKSANLVGGGFGAKAAIEGIAIASVINSLTKRTKKWVIASIESVEGKALLLIPEVSDMQIRKYFRPAQDAIASNASGGVKESKDGIAEGLVQLSQMLEKGLLTRAEFNLAKKRLLES